MKRNFDLWMRMIDSMLEALTGVTSEDLVDYCWRDLFDDGVSAREAVTEFLAENY